MRRTYRLLGLLFAALFVITSTGFSIQDTGEPALTSDNSASSSEPEQPEFSETSSEPELVDPDISDQSSSSSEESSSEPDVSPSRPEPDGEASEPSSPEITELPETPSGEMKPNPDETQAPFIPPQRGAERIQNQTIQPDLPALLAAEVAVPIITFVSYNEATDVLVVDISAPWAKGFGFGRYSPPLPGEPTGILMLPSVTGSSIRYTVNDYKRGNYTYCVRALTSTDASIFIDIKPNTVPPTSPSIGKNPNKDWHNGNVVVSFSGGTNVSWYEYQLNGGAWTKGSSLTVSTAGTNTVNARSNNGSGVLSSVVSTTVKLDKTAPTGSYTLSPSAATAGPVTITFTPSDAGGSGLSTLKLPSGAAGSTGKVTYSAAANGNYAFTMTDKAGNTGTVTVKVSNISVKPTKPVITLNPNKTWSSANVAVTLSGSTPAANIARYEYQLNGGAWTSGASLTVSAQGTHTVNARAVSSAGLISDVTAATVKVDKVKPTKPTVTQSPNKTWNNTNVTVTLAGSTATSGISRYEYQLDGGAWTSGASLTVSAQGIHTVNARAVSSAGLISDVAAATVRVDKVKPTKPTVTQSPSKSWNNSNVTVTLAGGTAASGIARYEYQLDGGAWATGGTITITTDGTHTVNARAVSGSGLISDVTAATVRMDKTAPTSGYALSPPAGEWTTGPVTITLSPTDAGGSGLVSILCPDGTILGAAPFTHVVTSNGDYPFTVTDQAGNSSTVTVQVRNIAVLDVTATLSAPFVISPDERQLQAGTIAFENRSSVPVKLTVVRASADGGAPQLVGRDAKDWQSLSVRDTRQYLALGLRGNGVDCWLDGAAKDLGRLAPGQQVRYEMQGRFGYAWESAQSLRYGLSVRVSVAE